MIAIKTQENEIIMGLNYIFTMKHEQNPLLTKCRRVTNDA